MFYEVKICLKLKSKKKCLERTFAQARGLQISETPFVLPLVSNVTSPTSSALGMAPSVLVQTPILSSAVQS